MRVGLSIAAVCSVLGWSVHGTTNVGRVAKNRVATVNSSKVAGKEGAAVKGLAAAKTKTCCGYPLSAPLGFRMTFYWLAFEHPALGQARDDELYTRNGQFYGAFSRRFVKELRMEGTGILANGRVVNWAGKCDYGVGACFEELDVNKYPYGRGVGGRSLVPFRSIAVDPKVIPYGEPVYLPELDGMVLPDGSIHDGCVRADDKGGWIRRKHIDFFVVTKQNYEYLLNQLWGLSRVTPYIEDARCEYLRRR